MSMAPLASQRLLQALTAYGAYTLAGAASLWLSGSHDDVSLLYLAAGVGLAFVLGWGPWMALAVGLGSATVSWIGHTTGGGDPLTWAHWVSFAISGLGGGAQAWLAGRWLHPDPTADLRLEHPREILNFLMVAGPLSCTLNALLSGTALVWLGLLPAEAWANTTVTWWAGDTLGVLMGMPPMLTLLCSPRPLWKRRRQVMGLPMLAAMLLLAVGIRQMQSWEHGREAAAFRQEVDATTTAVKLRLSGYMSALESLRGVFDASDSVERSEFGRASRHWLEQLQGIQAMGWEERVPLTRLAEFEAAQRGEGVLGYRVFDLPDRSPPKGPEAVALRFIEPMEGNESAMGFNVLSRPHTREAYLRAIQDNLPTATAGTKLVQERGQQIGVVIYRAIYRDPNALPSERAESTMGTVFLALRMDDALNAVLKDMPTFMRACLLDVTGVRPQMLSGPADCADHDAPGADRSRAAHELTVPLAFAQRQWALRLWAVDPIPMAGGRATSWLFAISGVLFAAALSALLLVITGATERMAAAMNEARLQREAAERANQAKSEFLSRMSHELRTPLNAMLGFAQVMGLDRSEPLSAHQKQRVDQIQQAGWHLLDMIDDVLDISRIDSGTLNLQVENLDLQGLLQACLPLVQDTARMQQVEITLDHQLPSGWGVQADGTRLRQVIINLLSNAIKYNQTGGQVRVQSSMVKSPQGPMVNLVVTDTGLGMSEQQMAQLFQPFNRLGRERHGPDGTGIGLVISRHLVQLMGGQLDVRSREGDGSTFTVTLPAAPLPVPLTPSTAGQPQTLTTGAPSSSRSRHVLYVEDNLANSALVQAALTTRPWVQLTLTETIEDGLAALHDRLAAPLPDLILLDVHLPDASGLDFLKLAKANPETRHIPVVMISADATPEQVEACLGAGAACYLTKPVQVSDLLQQVDALLKPQP